MDLQYHQRKCRGSLRAWGIALWILWPVSAWAQATSEAPQLTAEAAPCLDLGESILVISGDVEDVELERALENSMAALEALECQPEPGPRSEARSGSPPPLHN